MQIFARRVLRRHAPRGIKSCSCRAPCDLFSIFRWPGSIHCVLCLSYWSIVSTSWPGLAVGWSPPSSWNPARTRAGPTKVGKPYSSSYESCCARHATWNLPSLQICFPLLRSSAVSLELDPVSAHASANDAAWRWWNYVSFYWSISFTNWTLGSVCFWPFLQSFYFDVILIL